MRQPPSPPQHPPYYPHRVHVTVSLQWMSSLVCGLVPVPALRTVCWEGFGLAVCPTLGLLATSSSVDNTLSVLTLPSTLPSNANRYFVGGLTRVCILGGATSPAPMQFRFSGGGG
jgi:hypothetical protein